MLRDALADAALGRNVRLFAAQVICSSADCLQIHQKHLRCAILRAVESRWGCDKEVVNSVDVQLLQTLVSWWEPGQEYSQEEQTVASRILEMLTEMTVPVLEERKGSPPEADKKTEVEQNVSGAGGENVTAVETTSAPEDAQASDKAHVDTYLNRAGRKIVLALITDLARVWSSFVKPPTAALRKMLSGSQQDHAFTILMSLLKAGIPVDSILHQLVKFLDDTRKPIARAATEALSAGLMLCKDQRLSERCGRDLRKKLEGCFAKDPMEYVALLQGLLKGNPAFECYDEDVMYLSDLIPKVSPGTRNRCLTCLHHLLKSQRELACSDTLHTLDYPGILLEPECTDSTLEVIQCVIRYVSPELRAATLAAVLETCAAATSQRRLLCYQILLHTMDCEAAEAESESGTEQKVSRKRRLGEDAASTKLPAWMKLGDGAVLRELSRGIADEDSEVASFVLNSLSDMVPPFSQFGKRFRECVQMPTTLHSTLKLLYHSSETPTDKLSTEPLISIGKLESNNEGKEGSYPDVQIQLSSIYGTLLHAAQLDEDLARAWLRAVLRALLEDEREEGLRRPLEDVQSSLLGDTANTEMVKLFSEEWNHYRVHAGEIGAKRKTIHV